MESTSVDSSVDFPLAPKCTDSFWSCKASISSIAFESSSVQNLDMGEKSLAECSFRRVQLRNEGLICAYLSLRAWTAETSSGVASGAGLVNSFTFSKHSAHASRPHILHSHELENIEVMQVSR